MFSKKKEKEIQLVSCMFPSPCDQQHQLNSVLCVCTAAAGDGGDRVTVRTSGHGHGYSGGHTSGGTAEHGGAAVVDPRNLNARSHLRSGAARRTAVGGYSLAGAILAVFP